ncbi:hypothetical protein GS506_20710 [Rhodococcus hoagii]|nr:hypothetical protein [Prescottella equi]
MPVESNSAGTAASDPAPDCEPVPQQRRVDRRRVHFHSPGRRCVYTSKVASADSWSSRSWTVSVTRRHSANGTSWP